MELLGWPCVLAAIAGLLLFGLRNKKFIFHARFVLCYTIVSIVSVLAIPLFALQPCNVYNCYYIAKVLRHLSWLMGVRWEVRGQNLLASEKGCVVVANHQSSLDIIGMFWFWHLMKKCAAVAKKEILYAGPFGIAAWLGGVVFIDRRDSARAKASMEEAARLMREEQTKLWVFPEGTRNKTRGLLPFKKGAFHVAIACQAPVLPVVYSPYLFINPTNHYYGSGRVIVTALPMIPTEGMTMDDLDTLKERVRDAMVKKYEEMSKELRAALPANYPGLENL